jgi:enolase
MTRISSLDAYEILDSRGKPTLRCCIKTHDGHEASADAPSGASTGSHEAHELRDNGTRYGGKGVQKAIAHIQNVISPALIDLDPSDQNLIDETLLALDGTQNKAKLGANTLLPVSMAAAKVAAKSSGLSFCDYLSGGQDYVLPTPMINIINGGAHANNNLTIQEFMIIPWGLPSFSEAIRASAETLYALGDLLQKAGHSTAVGDEGGFAPNLKQDQDALELILKAIEKAGYRPYEDIALGLDVAASECYRDGHYHITGHPPQDQGMWLDFWKNCANNYPIISIEDAFDEQDWDGWIALTQALGDRMQLVGDDLFVTHDHLLTRGIEQHAANAILIKPNQVGTLTETLRTMGVASHAGFNAVMSHRSGETEDHDIADLAVATACGQIKTGSLCRGERTAKYNALLVMAEQHQDKAIYAGKAPFDLKTKENT